MDKLSEVNSTIDLKENANKVIRLPKDKQEAAIYEITGGSPVQMVKLSMEVISLYKEQAKNDKQFQTLCNNAIIALNNFISDETLTEEEKKQIPGIIKEIIDKAFESNENARKDKRTIALAAAIGGGCLFALGIIINAFSKK